MEPVSDKVALVTGGTRGIGFGIACCLAREGYGLLLCGVRDEAAVEGSLSELRTWQQPVAYCRADLADPAAPKKLLDFALERFGGLQVLVNNAGIAPRERRDILEATESSFEEVMRVNLQGPYFLTQRIANWMIGWRQKRPDYRGCIVNVSSISAVVASPSRGEYCISKAGVSMATKLWAVRLAEYGIGVYEVRPGLIQTDMTAGVKEKYDQLISEGLLLQSRWGSPEDVGKTVAALVRGDLPYSTGSAIMIDGGMTLRRL